EVLPGAGNTGDARLAAQLAFGTDLSRHTRHFRREAIELVDHRVDRVRWLEGLALDVDRNLFREVAVGNSSGHVGDVSHLTRQVAGHRVDGVGQLTPGAGDAPHVSLATELTFGTYLAGHTSDL